MLDVERGDQCRRNRSHGARKLGVAGGAKKVRRPSTWEVMCRLLARMASQRRSVPCAELAAVKAGSEHRHGGPRLTTRPWALQAVDAGAARMFSSPKHTPLRVRVRPGGACEAHGTASRCSRRAWRVCGQVPELFHGSNARRGARPRGSARSDNRIINQQSCQPLGVCKSAGERTTARS